MSNSLNMQGQTTKNTTELEVLYFDEALKNYEEKNYKLCIIYLNKVKLDTSEKVRLFVDVTYDVWQDHAYNERHLYMRYIESAYTTLFDEDGAGDPNPYVAGILAQAEFADPMPIIPEMNNYWGPTETALKSVWDGLATPEEAATKAMEDYQTSGEMTE